MLNLKLFYIKSLITLLCLHGLFISFVYLFNINGPWLYIKDLIWFSIAFLALTTTKTSICKHILLIFSVTLIYVFFHFAFSDTKLIPKLASIRQLYIQYILFFIGAILIKHKNDQINIEQYFIKVFIFLCLFGLIERFFEIWQFIDIKNYFLIKGNKVYSWGYPGFWIEPIYTSIPFFNINGVGIPRLVSTFLDPINFAHSLVTVLSVFYYKYANTANLKHFLILSLFIFCIFLTFSKGGWLQFAIVLILLNHKLNLHLRLFSLIIFILPLILFYINSHAGFLVHWHGFISLADHISLFGDGFGTHGNYSFLFSNNSESKISDSFMAAFISQVGIFGLVLILIFYMVIYTQLNLKDVYFKNLVSLFLISFLSENSFNLMSIFVLMVMLGVSYNISKNNRINLSK